MYLNEDHVERVEQGANSAVYLTNGTYLIVRDHVDIINASIRSEKAALLTAALGTAAPDAVTALSAVPDESPRMQARP